MILVTGAAGFIGSHFVRLWLEQSNEPIISIDKLTYAAQPERLATLDNSQHTLIEADIGDSNVIKDILNKWQPRAIVNLAAESHIDRSIENPAPFHETNIEGSARFFQSCYEYWQQLNSNDRSQFIFLQVSTDEVYQPLIKDSPFSDDYIKNVFTNTYSASKAHADDLLLSYSREHEFPVIISCCSNNFGPGQFPEKLIPLIINRAINHEPIPVYGDGLQVHDWLYVDDHCHALAKLLQSGKAGSIYGVTSNNPKTNIDIVMQVCKLMDELRPTTNRSPHKKLITFVEGRPFKDKRFTLNCKQLQKDCDWKAQMNFNDGLRQTVISHLNKQ